MQFSRLMSFVLAGLLAMGMANASDLKTEMFKMNKGLNSLLESQTGEEFSQAAEKFIAQVQGATVYLPKTVDESDEAAVKGYQAGMQALIDEVEQAKTLADEGKLDEAKEQARKLFDLKKQYHIQYK